MYTSAKTGDSIEDAFQMLWENIYKHNLGSTTKYIGWEDDAATKNDISEASDYISLQSYYQWDSFRLTRNAHVFKNESVYSGIDRKRKKCQC